MIFIFSQTNRSKWSKIADNAKKLADEFDKNKKDFTIEIKEFSKKRSRNQLTGFWRLVDLIQEYMNNQGNNFSKSEVASYFKILSGHSKIINGIEIEKSIANKSDTTISDMKKIIDSMIKFGIDNGIKNCHLSPYEEKEILKYFK
jgi:ribosomal protein S17E